MSPWRFLLWNVLGGLAWGTGFSLLGYFAGEGYRAALRWAGRGSIAATILVGALFAAYLVKRALFRPVTRAVEEDPADPDRNGIERGQGTGPGGL